MRVLVASGFYCLPDARTSIASLFLRAFSSLIPLDSSYSFFFLLHFRRSESGKMVLAATSSKGVINPEVLRDRNRLHTHTHNRLDFS